MCNFQKARVAYKWQKRAEQIHQETGQDCDQVARQIVREMKADGLVINQDFVAVYGRIDGTRHMCLEMWGKNCKPKNGKPVFKFNGYRIDGTAPGHKMEGIWKGEYGQS